jgi:hypothetical protein
MKRINDGERSDTAICDCLIYSIVQCQSKQSVETDGHDRKKGIITDIALLSQKKIYFLELIYKFFIC